MAVKQTYKPSNPYYAYVELYVGNAHITSLPPNHLIRFRYQRIAKNSVNKFNIQVFDETAIELEYQIIKGADEVKFRYGYSEGQMSPYYKGSIQDYTANFSPSGATLNIFGISNIQGSMYKPKAKAYNNKRVSDIAKEVALDEGWKIGNIVETIPVADGDSANRNFIRTASESAPVFLNRLLPYAKSSDHGDSSYIFNFTDKEDGVYFNFYPEFNASQATNTSASDVARKTSNDTNASKIVKFEFKWGSGDRDSRVISFTPSYKGASRKAVGGGMVDAIAVDTRSNQFISTTQDEKTDPDRVSLATKSLYDYSEARRVIGGSTYSIDEIKNHAAYLWSSTANQQVTADLVIFGDCNINFTDVINVQMLNKDGIPHHTSGNYQTMSVEDEISNGEFTTSLRLARNGLNVGTISAGGITITKRKGSATPTSTSPDDQNTPPWTPSGEGNADIVNLANTKVGQVGGREFQQWAGLGESAWCAAFVSWCAHKVGALGDIIPKFTYCRVGVEHFIKQGLYHTVEGEPNYRARPGDICFFVWGHDPTSDAYDPDHVGIVVEDRGSEIITIEGNTSGGPSGSQDNGNGVWRRTRYRAASGRGVGIVGFGSPNYKRATPPNNGGGGGRTAEDYQYMAAAVSAMCPPEDKYSHYALIYCILNKAGNGSIVNVIIADNEINKSYPNYLKQPSSNTVLVSVREVFDGLANNPIGAKSHVTTRINAELVRLSDYTNTIEAGGLIFSDIAAGDATNPMKNDDGTYIGD